MTNDADDVGSQLSVPGDMEAHGSISISGHAELSASASTSMTDAIVAVTSNSMQMDTLGCSHDHRSVGDILPQGIVRLVAPSGSRLPDRSHVRRRPRQLSDIDPGTVVVVTVFRHPPLLQPAPAVALDGPNLVLTRLIQEGTGHEPSLPRPVRSVHPVVRH
jgi:hypothetical protein